MILKKDKLNLSVNRKVIFHFLYIFFLLGIGIVIQKFGVIGNIIIPIFASESQNYLATQKRTMNSFISNFPGKELILDIPFDHYQQLEYHRQQALKIGLLVSNNNDYVGAKLSVDEIPYNINIRLKGDGIDHIKDELKSSYRIRVKGDNTILGMKQFSIHHPRERNYLNEWLFHKTINREGLISLRYFFVKVILNGTDLGIYALEEHFERRLLENNQRKPGVIVRFDEEKMWDENVQFGKWMFGETRAKISGYGSYYSSEIDAFQTNKIHSNSVYI